MKIKRSADELIIQESPGCLWVVSLLFICLGSVFIYGALGGLKDYQDHSPWIINLSFVFGIAAFSTGVWRLYHAPYSQVKINRPERTVRLIRYGLYQKKQTVHHFDEVERFLIVKETDSEGDAIWSVGIRLLDGETIKINSLESHSGKEEGEIVLQANRFMSKPES